MSEPDEVLIELRSGLNQKAGERCALERAATYLESRAGVLFIRSRTGDLAEEVRTLAREIREWATKASEEQSAILRNIKAERENNPKPK